MKLETRAGKAAAVFLPDSEIASLEPLGAGHINDTFLVRVEFPGSGKFVLQRINRLVFLEPAKIMANLRVLAGHLEQRLAAESPASGRAWEVVRPVCTPGGDDFFIDDNGGFWRMINFVDHAVSFTKTSDAALGREVGRALGVFHRLTSNLDPVRLHDTLPGFHVVPLYLARYDEILPRPYRPVQGVAARYCADIIEERRDLAPVLENGIRSGKLHVRVIHGDPKLANIMFDEESGRAVTIVDLDTVKPGLVHYDIGDCLRSCCNLAGETEDPEKAGFNTDICRQVLSGYLGEMENLMTETDFEYIYPAVRLITFELGLRFFTDYLAGDQYFKVEGEDSGINLNRAFTQFKVLQEIEEKEVAIKTMVRDFSGK